MPKALIHVAQQACDAGASVSSLSVFSSPLNPVAQGLTLANVPGDNTDKLLALAG